MKKFLSIILSILIVAQSAWALDRYVNPACKAACDGTTWEKGWATLADITWTDLDDETSNLYLGAGTYNEQLYVRHNTTGSILTIKPYNGLVTINAGESLIGIRLDHGYVTIDGYYEGLTGSRGIRVTSSAYGIGHWYSGLANLTYRYLEVDTNDKYGIHINSTSTGPGLLIEYCYIHDNGTGAAARMAAAPAEAAQGDGIVGNTTTDAYGLSTIRYNVIEDNAEDGINVGGGCDVYGNTIDLTNSIPLSHADGIQGSGGYWRIYNNLFIGGTQQIFVETVDANLENVQIFNNVFNDDAGSGPSIIFRNKNIVDQTNKSISNVLIANNTFINPNTFTVRFMQDFATILYSNVEISNNISYSPGVSHLLFEDSNYTKSQLILYSNVFYSPNAVGYNASDDTGGPYDTAADLNTGTGFTGNTNSQPIFTNYAGGNYILSSGDTVAKNAGKDLSSYCAALPALCSDKSGVARPQGAAWDIGAYEYYEQGSIHGVTSMGVSKK